MITPERYTIRKQKNFAMRLLTCLEKIDNAPKYIMGGAPRNWRVGKQAVDYDVYLPSDVNMKAVIDLLESSFNQKVDLHISLPEGHEYGKMIHSTYHVFINDLPKQDVMSTVYDVNIVLHDKRFTAQQILHDNFAFSICQAVMTSSGTMMYTNAFEETMMNKIVRGMNGIKKNSNYAKKIESYFASNFSFIYE